MPFRSGERLGPYEILAPIGAGGMGEVYGPAIPDSAATLRSRSPGLRDSAERFEREARAIAALNHPNIVHALRRRAQLLVMEFVPGWSWSRSRTARPPGAGGLRLAEALPIARQIAEALEAAHEKGIVHRDLKPANVKIAPTAPSRCSTSVWRRRSTRRQPRRRRICEFADDRHRAQTAARRDPRHCGVHGARAGEGTARRQARGHLGVRRGVVRDADGPRAVSGRDGGGNHRGGDQGRHQLDRLPSDLPPAIRSLLARCLERDPKQRLRDIGEARIALTDPASIAPTAVASPMRRHGWSRMSWLAWAALALGLTGAAAAAGWWLKPAVDLPLRRIDLADPLASANGWALAPDGSRIAYFSGAHLYVRALDALAPQDLGAVHITAAQPFWSPDGRTIGFFSGGALNTIAAEGGAVLQVCRIPATGRALDFVWRPDGTILFTVSRDSAYSVTATGGTPVVYLAIAPKTEIEFNSLSLLPDNRLIVTTRLREPPSFRTDVVAAGSDRRRTTIIATRT